VARIASTYPSILWNNSYLTALPLNSVADGHKAATQALKASGCPLPAGYEADTVKWENREKDLERAVKNIKASPPNSR
jgi:hypothetical protein